MISNDRRNITLTNVSDAVSWLYALAVNSDSWSSGLTKVECVLDVRASPDRPLVRMNVYRQTPTSVTLTWSPVVCATLAVQSYQLCYSPTEHVSGLTHRSII